MVGAEGAGAFGGTLADFALIRRFAPPSPPGGKASFGDAKFFMFYFLMNCKIGVVSVSHGTTAVAFPRVGKVARQRRMRAKSASGTA